MSRRNSIRLSIGEKLRYLLDRPLRRAHRAFKGFPLLPYNYILDIGAHEGSFAVLALRRFKPKNVWLVEADPELAGVLRERFARDSRCRVIHCAVSKSSGSAELRLNQNRASSSLLPISSHASRAFGVDMREIRTVTVPARSLNELFDREKIPHIDLCKVDIQGAEKLMIQGGDVALAKTRLLYIEVLFDRFYEGCADFGEINALLRDHGFKLHLLTEFRRDTGGDLAYANALYHNSAFVEPVA
jgi:FkbM family methyltransferase